MGEGYWLRHWATSPIASNHHLGRGISWTPVRRSNRTDATHSLKWFKFLLLFVMSSTDHRDPSSNCYLPRKRGSRSASTRKTISNGLNLTKIEPKGTVSYAQPLSYWDHPPTIFCQYYNENGVRIPKFFAHLPIASRRARGDKHASTQSSCAGLLFLKKNPS